MANLLFDSCFKPLWKHKMIADAFKTSSFLISNKLEPLIQAGKNRDNLANYRAIPAYKLI